MDNPNAFKNFINENVVRNIADGIANHYPEFKKKKFLELIKELPALEMKARALLITKELRTHLPQDYPVALDILMKAMESADLRGFSLWPFSEYISQFGLDHFDISMKGMYRLTSRFTSEFAIRPFLLKDHKKVFKYFSKWVTDKNVHIRRWISEGSRPLLPWGQKIPLFVMDPTHTLIYLDKLKFDEEMYVRKSVANHLNDITKNHPQVVIEILRMWEKDTPAIHKEKIEWIKRHALRTLIKKGHPGALKLMGVGEKTAVSISKFKCDKKVYLLNDVLNFNLKITSISKRSQKLIIDYGIDFVKANGSKGRKIFKLKTLELGAGESVDLSKKHSLKPITTMKYYAGVHHLSIQVNGKIMDELTFKLEI
jgi:3-methyladenine DNA glycosylase AlkC